MHYRLPVILGVERERSFEPGVLVLQDDECLVGPFPLAIVLRCESNLERVGGSKSDGLRQRRLSIQPTQKGSQHMVVAQRQVYVEMAHFSFTPSDAFFATTVKLPSSKLQDDAACAMPAAASRSAEASGCENRIVAI